MDVGRAARCRKMCQAVAPGRAATSASAATVRDDVRRRLWRLLLGSAARNFLWVAVGWVFHDNPWRTGGYHG